MPRRTLAIAVASALFALPAGLATAGEDMKPDLTIGDPAPKIDIEHWIKGDKVKSFKNGNVYVVEFWATWCGPCIASMPHLSKLQKEYKDYDVTIIGVSDEDLQTVSDFLVTKYRDGKVQNDRIQYTLTTDPDKSVKKAYFQAAGQRGIPASFIVGKDQKIEWIGHPMGMDAPLDAVVRDTWDRDKFKAEKIMMVLRQKSMEKDWDGVIEKIDELVALSPMYAGYNMQKFMILAKEKNDYDAAFAVAASVAEDNWDNAGALNQMAWMMATEDLDKRDLDLALRAAKRANDLTEEKDAAILDTLARVYFEQGDIKKAVDWQRKAVEYAPEGRMADDLKAALERYEAAM